MAGIPGKTAAVLVIGAVLGFLAWDNARLRGRVSTLVAQRQTCAVERAQLALDVEGIRAALARAQAAHERQQAERKAVEAAIAGVEQDAARRFEAAAREAAARAARHSGATDEVQLCRNARSLLVQP